MTRLSIVIVNLFFPLVSHLGIEIKSKLFLMYFLFPYKKELIAGQSENFVSVSSTHFE